MLNLFRKRDSVGYVMRNGVKVRYIVGYIIELPEGFETYTDYVNSLPYLIRLSRIYKLFPPRGRLCYPRPE